jgi:hypothetical protein
VYKRPVKVYDGTTNDNEENVMTKVQLNDLDLIADAITRGKQNWRREITWRWSGHKIRAVIDRDFYDFQSRIFVEVWSEASLSWNRVRTLEGKEYGDLPSATTRDVFEIEDATESLIDELLAYAQDILS